jgi:hypothetical protein
MAFGPDPGQHGTMGDVINLNRARKARAKAGCGAKADANRAAFGRTKAEKQAHAAEQARQDALLDGAKRDD